jgi:hypothetical protein
MAASGSAPGNNADPVAQIEALLGPRLRDPEARARRTALLAVEPTLAREDAALLEALDALVDLLINRARPRTGTSTRPRDVGVVRAPPPVPPAPSAPADVPSGSPGSTTRSSQRPKLGTATDELPAPPLDDEPLDPAAVAFAQSETIISARPDVRSAPPAPSLVEPIPGSAPATFLLYDDVVQLSALNDWDAAFISIERLLVLARVEDHVADFVRSNEAHLLGLYEPALKSFSRVPKRRELRPENTMHRVFLNNVKVIEVLALVDRKLAIRKMFESSQLSRLEICATLVVLQRAGVLDI